MSSKQRQRNPKWQTRALEGTGSRRSLQGFRVEIIGGRDKGGVAAAKGAELDIGTAPGSDLLLTDGAVSRHHCVIRAEEAGYLLRDLGSTNGTFVNELQVVEAWLSPGAVLRLGESTVRFELIDDELSEALSPHTSFGEVIGTSPAMRRLFELVEKAADTPVTILITGETGTGKSALARSIHSQGTRADQPFVVVDCGAIPDTLIESELFGHEKGAFTGAEAQRIGAFERAQGGTVFLDEVGELSLDTQPKLLRVLENRELRRVGGSETIALDIRVVAATHRDLRAEVNAGSFRSDLYYRLNVMGLELPPLRQRREDIPALVEGVYRALSGEPEASPPAELLAKLMRHQLPGNVRELRAIIQRHLVLGELDRSSAGSATSTAHEIDFSSSYRDAKERALREWESRYVPELLARYDGNISRAARAVSMDRNHLRKLKKALSDPE